MRTLLGWIVGVVVALSCCYTGTCLGKIIDYTFISEVVKFLFGGVGIIGGFLLGGLVAGAPMGNEDTESWRPYNPYN